MRRLVACSLVAAGVSACAADDSAPADLKVFDADISLDRPAVGSLNGQVDYLGGWMNSDEGHNFSGRVSLPVGEHFGAQGDALYAHVIGDNDATDFFSGGAHFFWRDPDRALVGVFAAGESGEVQYLIHAGVEAEYYLTRLTFGLSAGLGHLEYDQTVSFFETDQTRFVGSAFAAWYPIDQLVIELGYANLFENHLGQAVIEYQTPLRGLSLAADAGIGSHGYDYALLGVRYHFGANKTLIQRHREDDPGGLLRRVMNGLGLVGADLDEQALRVTGSNSGGVTFGTETLIEVNRAIQRQNGGGGVMPPLPPPPLTTSDDRGRIIVPPAPPGG